MSATELRVEAVAKASRILKAFEPERRVMTVRDIATRTGLPRSTCHAICSTLVGEELLEQLPGGGYRLGPGLAEMGAQVIERTGLVEAATASMTRLSSAVGGEVHLGQFVSGYIVYLSRVEHERRLPMRNRMGLRAPAHLTGCGKAALSGLDDARVVELVGGHDDVDLPGLLDELAVARRRGFVVSDKFQAGVVSFAAPLVDPAGAVVGGISVAHARSMVDARRSARFGAAVRAAAAEASERLQALRWRG
jgi:DNA-binding IclR family transcriptional regulator